MPSLWATGCRPNSVDWDGGVSVVLHRGSNCPLLRAMDGRIMCRLPLDRLPLPTTINCYCAHVSIDDGLYHVTLFLLRWVTVLTWLRYDSWPLSPEHGFLFAQTLLGQSQFLAVQEYVRLSQPWCDVDAASRFFILGQSYLHSRQVLSLCKMSYWLGLDMFCWLSCYLCCSNLLLSRSSTVWTTFWAVNVTRLHFHLSKP